MASDDPVYTVRLIQPGVRAILVVLVLFIVFAAGLLFWRVNSMLAEAPPPPPYTVDLTQPEAGQTVAVESAYDRILAWVDGPNGRELRVFSTYSGRLLGTYKYPPKPSDK